MIHKVTDDWSKIEGEMREGANVESEDLQQILKQMVGVRDVLKRMCQVSVTRTTLKKAVREALLPIVREHRDELFPELAELRERLVAAGKDPQALEIFEGATEKAAALTTFREKLETFEERIRQLSEFETQVGGQLDGVKESLNAELESSRVSFDEKIQKVRDYLGRLETSIPETARQAAGEVEERLRREIQEMVQQLTDKLAELHDIMERIESVVPTREALEAVDRRLERLEGCFTRISDQVQNIDSVTPELRSLGDRFTSLRAQIADVSGDLEQTGRGMKDLRDGVGNRLDELQGLLQGGINRWESDQSQMRERLTSLRDNLRDQLQTFGRQVESAEGSFWGKLTGKRDAGLKLSGQEFDDLSAKLESIIGGLEGIIARKASS